MINSTKANLYILVTYTIWGIQPLYWRLFTHFPLPYILAHRIIWASIFMFLIVLLTNRKKQFLLVLGNKKQMLFLIVSSIAITLNWLLNIYAAYTKQVVESSLGHYITPIVIILIGIVVFKEKIELHKIIALVLVAIGVISISIKVGKLPLIAISILLTFTIYTFIKKINPADPVVEVTLETLIAAPFFIGYLLYNYYTQGTHFFYTTSFSDIILLISTGIFTFLPLVLYSYGVKSINFTTLGFIQYWAPTISLCVGIFVLKEAFSTGHLFSFSFIWAATLIVLISPILKKGKL
ncbi:EamA family transporter RarD [Clostridiaceae bacterium HSG29]|nr:EamA family transporter RarD [Clostridiaceae bacterium HSG29]